MPLYGLSEAFSRLNSPYPLSLSRWPWLHQIKNLLKEINFLLSLISDQTEMCDLYYLVENKIVASFLNKSQFILGLQWWDAQADASHASCMSLVGRSPTISCCYNHANSRIPSLHLLKQLYGMGSAISAPHQSPAQGCKKTLDGSLNIWTNFAMLCRESVVQVKQFGNAKKFLPKDSTKTMEIKKQIPF